MKEPNKFHNNYDLLTWKLHYNPTRSNASLHTNTSKNYGQSNTCNLLTLNGQHTAYYNEAWLVIIIPMYFVLFYTH